MSRLFFKDRRVFAFRTNGTDGTDPIRFGENSFSYGAHSLPVVFLPGYHRTVLPESPVSGGGGVWWFANLWGRRDASTRPGRGFPDGWGRGNMVAWRAVGRNGNLDDLDDLDEMDDLDDLDEMDDLDDLDDLEGGRFGIVDSE